jgi:hypothetical protein
MGARDMRALQLVTGQFRADLSTITASEFLLQQCNIPPPFKKRYVKSAECIALK